MKTICISLAGVFAVAGLLAFEDKSDQVMNTLQTDETMYAVYDTIPGTTLYRDLNTGEAVDIWYDAVGMRTLNKKTGAPIEFYVNTKTNDTVFGRGRFVVNSYVIKGDDGKWKLDDGKVKVDGDELKVKVGDQKLKIDEGEIKVKSKGTKVKSDDGEIKVKSKDGKAKYEDDKTKIKTKDSTKNDK